ncbi:hypothetical protein [Streptomyces sp. P9-A4]|uniref:hypothetical protein n=1 Tax=Streptomyces sp. P9-A4 TaxID=3072285 RepID=UPI002FC71867
MGSEKQGARASQLAVPLSTLSNYWSGRRMPRVHKLREIYHVVRRHSASAELPVGLAELEGLRARALTKGDRDQRAASVIADSSPVRPVPQEPFLLPGTVPATGPAGDRHSGENDKANDKASDRTREALAVLRAARSSGDLRHLIGTAWSASRTLSEAEFCDAVSALHVTSDLDLAETLLLADGQRSADGTMRLALALMGAGLASSAELIMRASLPRGGDERG